MIDFEIGFVVGVLAAVFVVCCYKVWTLWQRADSRDEWKPIGTLIASPRAQEAMGKMFADVDKEKEMFSKTGTSPEFSATAPVRIPWHIRRRELEEAARSKRKKLESFQEYV